MTGFDALLVLFVIVMAIGYVGIILDIIDRHRWPFVQPNHRHVFRYVHREDRAAYRRMMRRTLAVQSRDLERQFRTTGRLIAKALIPTLQNFADTLRKLLEKAR